MFVEAIEAILGDHCGPRAVRAIEHGASPAPLWNSIEASGFLELLAPEAQGGGGLGLDALFPVIAVLGRHAVPVPLAQSIVARALLMPHDLPVPAGMITFAAALQTAPDGSLRCPLTPYGTVAATVLAPHDEDLVMLSCEPAERIPTGVHGSQFAHLHWRSGTRPEARVPGAARALQACAAAVHATLLAGAMRRVLEMSLQYANDRTQFGKPIGKFQAIQQQLAAMAQQVVAAQVAAEAGWRTRHGQPDLLRAAIAKARASEAVTPVAATAHALHGAIGVTAEYDLQLYTRRLHDWRMAHGSETYWHGLIGEALLAGNQTLVDFAREAA